MIVSPVKTPLVHAGDDLFDFLRSSLPPLKERSVVAVTSKIVSLCTGRVVPIQAATKEEKHELVRADADSYLEAGQSQYNVMLTIRGQTLGVNSGIDESNADGHYVLLPEDSYRSAREIWEFLRDYHGVRELGVIITDSKTFPLQWGTIGTCLGHCGFLALNDKIGEHDLFGHVMQVTQVNAAEALAVASVLEMGEVAESQPLCVIEQAEMVEFEDVPPSRNEIENLKIAKEDDMYAPLLTSVEWKEKD